MPPTTEPVLSVSKGSGHGFDPGALPGTALEFLTERHLASLTTLRADGSPHVVPVGFTYDPRPGWRG